MSEFQVSRFWYLASPFSATPFVPSMSMTMCALEPSSHSAPADEMCTPYDSSWRLESCVPSTEGVTTEPPAAAISCSARGMTSAHVVVVWTSKPCFRKYLVWQTSGSGQEGPFSGASFSLSVRSLSLMRLCTSRKFSRRVKQNPSGAWTVPHILDGKHLAEVGKRQSKRK